MESELNFMEKLNEYFDKTPPEQIEKDWEATEVWDEGDEYGGFIEKCAVENSDVDMHNLSVLFLEGEVNRLKYEQENITDDSLNDYVETEISKIEGILGKLKQ